MGDVMGAVQVAASGLSPDHHDDFASFLATMAGPTGAQLALIGLHGLSLAMEVELCISTGQWRRALACVEALVLGCEDRSHLRFGGATARRYAQATEAVAAAAATMAAASAPAAAAAPSTAVASASSAAAAAVSGPQPDDPPPPSKVATNQAMWSYMGFGGLFVDNFSQPTEEAAPAQRKARDPTARGKVDWGAPLGGGWAYKKGGGGRAKPKVSDAAAGAAEAATTGDAGTLAPSQHALQLAMRLVEGSQDAGILDVTAAAAQLLLEYRGCLPPAQLARLAARMAEAGMNEDVKLLVDSCVRSGSHNGQAVGFVAASLTGELAVGGGGLGRVMAVGAAALMQGASEYHLLNIQTSRTCMNV